MPTTLRSNTAKIVGLAGRDLDRLWRLIGRGVDAGEALHDLLPAIIEQYGQLGAALSAEWYDQQREKAGVRGRFAAIPVDPGDRGAHALVGWAVSEATDDVALKALILGGTQRRIADHIRGTVMGSSVQDSQADGWMRVGVGACGFCAMLIGRGAVYSEATVDFGAHDHCRCEAAPAFKGQPRPVEPYVPSSRNVTDADRERVARWLEARA